MEPPRLAALPAASLDEPPAHIMDRFAGYLAETLKGYNFTQSLKARMEFQNPYILDAVVQQFAIDEIASNYPAHVFDPHGYAPSEYYEALSATQQRAEEERAAAQATRTAVPFVSAGLQLGAGSSALTGSAAAAMRPIATAPMHAPAVAAALAAAREAAAAVVSRQQPAAVSQLRGDELPASRPPDARGRRSKWDTER